MNPTTVEADTKKNADEDTTVIMRGDSPNGSELAQVVENEVKKIVAGMVDKPEMDRENLIYRINMALFTSKVDKQGNIIIRHKYSLVVVEALKALLEKISAK